MTNSNANSGGEIKGVKVGVVDSDARDKTRRVVIAYRAKHPKYGKYVSKRTRLHVHDENNESKVGDMVEIIQCRPMSKTKAWKLLRVVKSGGEG
ncbi:MAG TPA: 30S ribosomal protein S17 [Phycisphaerales bacterium]|nr:30S ribosomal protein S17 [Phycisphaerales bacterium]